MAIGDGNQVINFQASLDGSDVTSALMPCLFSQSPGLPPPPPPQAFQTLQTSESPVMLPGGGVGLSCPNVDSLLDLTPGLHVFEVRLALFDEQTNTTTTPLLKSAVNWDVYRGL
jgi:hypothetical protein